jgi:hypothetical protein
VATQLWTEQVTIQPGTPQSAPQVNNLTLPVGVVDRIVVMIPPGPLGAMGWALGAAGQPVIPYAPNTFIVADHEVVDVSLEQVIDSGAWQVFGYNNGVYPHTLYMRFYITNLGIAEVPAAITPVAASGGGQLGGTLDLGGTGLTLSGFSAPPTLTLPTEQPPPAITVPPPSTLPATTIPPAPAIAPPAGVTSTSGGTPMATLAAPIVGGAMRPQNDGYWLVGADGGVFALGNAPYLGGMAGKALAKPIVGIAATNTGGGYILIGADGGVFAFGDASFHGSIP